MFYCHSWKQWKYLNLAMAQKTQSGRMSFWVCCLTLQNNSNLFTFGVCCKAYLFLERHLGKSEVAGCGTYLKNLLWNLFFAHCISLKLNHFLFLEWWCSVELTIRATLNKMLINQFESFCHCCWQKFHTIFSLGNKTLSF